MTDIFNIHVFSWFKQRRRKKLLAEPFPHEWFDFLVRNVRHFELLAEDDQQKLQNKLRIMVAERRWEGCAGLELNDEIKVTIAGQACLLLLGVEDGYYFDGVPSILVYPGAYTRPGRLQNGLIVDEQEETYGEAWHRGPIVLSWRDVLRGARNPRDGRNLVIHEFAHHLDGLDGEMAGSPPLPSRLHEQRWFHVTQQEFLRLCDQARRGEATLLDQYGASNRAEFFAVSTECFFERPVEMKQRHPQLYELFQQFYRQDPAKWHDQDQLLTSRST